MSSGCTCDWPHGDSAHKGWIQIFLHPSQFSDPQTSEFTHDFLSPLCLALQCSAWMSLLRVAFHNPLVPQHLTKVSIAIEGKMNLDLSQKGWLLVQITEKPGGCLALSITGSRISNGTSRVCLWQVSHLPSWAPGFGEFSLRAPERLQIFERPV